MSPPKPSPFGSYDTLTTYPTPPWPHPPLINRYGHDTSGFHHRYLFTPSPTVLPTSHHHYQSDGLPGQPSKPLCQKVPPKLKTVSTAYVIDTKSCLGRNNGLLEAEEDQECLYIYIYRLAHGGNSVELIIPWGYVSFLYLILVWFDSKDIVNLFFRL